MNGGQKRWEVRVRKRKRMAQVKVQPEVKIHQNQIRDAAADTHAPVRLLRQSAPIYQGSLPPLPGE